MALTPDVWEKFKRGDYGQVDAAIVEVLCSVGRQLAYRLDKLIDVLEPDEVLPGYRPGERHTPMGRLIELNRLELASYPKDHRIAVITNAGDLIINNPLPYSIPVLVTNLDNAQFLFYGTSRGTVLNAPLIDPESKEKIILSPNSDLFGIVLGAAINVGISNLDLPTV